jgi:hypothetical protein
MQLNRLFEVFVVHNVLCSAYQDESHMMATMIARREFLSIHACDLMLAGMIGVVHDLVDARSRHFIAGLELITDTNIGHDSRSLKN